MADQSKTWKQIATLGEAIVGIVNFKDRIIVATSRGVYELKDGVLEELKFRTAE